MLLRRSAVLLCTLRRRSFDDEHLPAPSHCYLHPVIATSTCNRLKVMRAGWNVFCFPACLVATSRVPLSFSLPLHVLPRCYASLVILHLGTVAGPTLHSVSFCYVSFIDNISIHLMFCRQIVCHCVWRACWGCWSVNCCNASPNASLICLDLSALISRAMVLR